MPLPSCSRCDRDAFYRLHQSLGQDPLVCVYHMLADPRPFVTFEEL